MHSMYLAGVPLPSSMLRQPIHFAPGAIPIWLPAPSSPIAVPVVWVPWKKSSQGNGESLPQGLPTAIMNGVVPIVIVIGVHSVPAAIVRL